ncbi:hypothetical protein [uncultured Christiangramia sp.]|uniref:hypothetical protein n=1 Tax=uncultured Christiangramia sp. TaxID=503836 RepID=UPI00261C154B|nr:hypothetical protein [uncultured Christiangramia sp.]
MATKYPNPIIHTYREINPGKYRSVKHYELKNLSGGANQLSETLNIQKDRQFAKSMPEYWLKKRIGKKWSKPVTGLFQTEIENIYFGDSDYKKNLIFVHFSENQDEVTIFYYKEFYTRDRDDLVYSVQRHIWLNHKANV